MTRERQAERIRARLKVLGWSDKRLALQIGMAPSDLSKLLKTGTPHAKKRSMEAVLAWRIARALGLTPHYILFGDFDQLSREVLKDVPAEPD